MSTIPAEREPILRKRSFGHVATLGPHGEPQSNPVWIDWDGRVLRISQTTDRQKYHNLKRDARVAVSVHDPDDPYRYVELRGTVEDIDADRDNAFINKLAKKYIDRDVYPWAQPMRNGSSSRSGRTTPPCSRARTSIGGRARRAARVPRAGWSAIDHVRSADLQSRCRRIAVRRGHLWTRKPSTVTTACLGPTSNPQSASNHV